jgi:glycosyltransferase involved in cell wall biosynthesis
MSDRPRLLFLCQTLPWPPDGGVWIRSYHVLRLLARAYDVHALCFERSDAKGPSDPAAGARALRELAAVDVFEVPQRKSRLRYAWDHLRSLARGRVYTELVYDSPAFAARLCALLRTTRFDLVHADSLVDLAAHLPACAGRPVVGVHHNVESELLRRRAAVETSRARRAYLLHQAGLMEGVERAWCPRVALNVAVSAPDRDALERLAPGARITVVPNGVDLEAFRPAGTGGEGVAFVGGMNWFPNRDGLEFFCAEVLPRLRATRPGLAVRGIGAASADERKQYARRHRVELTGYLADVAPAMRAAACHVVPLRVGGGTRLKILGSWAMGKPVVSTSLGCEGLAAVDGDNILIRDDPAAFADAVLSVLRDAALARRLGERGRATAERVYAWEVIGRQMIEAYRTVSDENHTDASVPGSRGEARSA